MSAKHTPGPWRVEGYSVLRSGEVTGHTISHGINGYADGPEGYVCTTSGTTEADANLIAAAPELLEALRQIGGGHVAGIGDLVLAHDWHAVVNLFQRAARAAIAKATGETK